MFLFVLVMTSLVFSAPTNQNSVSGKQTIVSGNEETGTNGSQSESSNGTQLIVSSQVQTKNQGVGQQLGLQERERIMLREGNYTDSLGQRLQVKNVAFGVNELMGNKSQVRTQLRIDTETDDLGRTRLMVNFSNGKNAEIKIMPDTASQTALERLRLRNCSLNENCTIQLKEVGNGNQTKVVYDMQAQKETKILGLFKARMNLETQVDAETGSVITTKKPWWSFLSSN